MKKFTLTALTIFFASTFCAAQDIITKKTGEDILATITEIGPSEIRYKKFDNQRGPTFVLPKYDILMVRYEDGTKDIFSEESSLNSHPQYIDPFVQGQRDASRYYDGYQPAGTATLVVGLLSPLVGLVPAVACSSTQPKDINLNYPNPNLMKKSEYYLGYTQKARKIKRAKIWTNWGIAFGVNVVAALLLFN